MIIIYKKKIMSKDILFYSNHDDYSKQIIDTVKRNHIKNILPLCIDDTKIKIPNFITVVPTIYINSSKEIIVDENIKRYIDKIIETENTKLDSIEPYDGSIGTDYFHDIDLETKEDGDLDSFFRTNDKPDERKVLDNRAQNMDSLQKLRHNDINQIFEK